MNRNLQWHIFCRVIDNFGDIGVCWRLARQLTNEHNIQVTLWVDDLISFHALWPSVDHRLTSQTCAGVLIKRWQKPFAETVVGQVVVEAFGCELPTNYLQAMVRAKPIWINLEYLSAEEWVKDYHLNQSPVRGMRKTFFFPGFEADTGGLLWDQALIQLSQTSNDSDTKVRIVAELGITHCASTDLLASLFSYENTALPELLEALSQHNKPVTLFVPEGRMAAGVAHWLGRQLLAGEQVRKGQLTLNGLAFMDQSRYDQLLAICDLNFVRGEESFVRTQMLAKPFVWHIYPQQEEVHILKLEAFLELYLADAPEAVKHAILAASRAWNQPQLTSKNSWHLLLEQLPAIALHARRWQAKQMANGDLASNIVHFCSNQV
ncbi:elongation factor P maturation arginine rhamnosyltransferase EarP [Simiduia curdlanivorans]|uniref:Protein-arginine rhamnosyltransferase n=1 Tax=Simiduia curdlanivorans TaxID=1492769 RepID=A0ABV8V2K5_9GAMM|nr:elongation factor P maturation arginine rhamnosyltransferase EarP [Simiduia curdlanivorans]MDN3637265.1 elongation factor P maturation arginine rhamnosyltransferase EarP [Simiduia curdlanivorans]